MAAIDTVAAHTGATHAQIALAWLIAQPGVTAPIASATTSTQIVELTLDTRLKLGSGHLEIPNAASDTAPRQR